ncbi:MAG TPA: alpha/beta hydrolase [Solirubrobacterales bacterium]|nr:alpha/beta hydrolase [Solirubrobacterales bacterium]
MQLKTHAWGAIGAESVVCVHGITQDGAVFEEMGKRLAERGHSVVAVDLRGHGESGREPPWDTETHVEDVLETIDGLGVGRASWVGHSFGGRVAASLATVSADRTERLVLLEPGLEVPVQRALQRAEIERLDWSFATTDGAVNALLSNDSIVAAPQDVVEAFVGRDVRKGPDGRFRFRFCPSAVVVAWSEMTLPAPPVAAVPTLLVEAEVPLFEHELRARYENALNDQLSWVKVPNGHNVLWESPVETIGAVERFLTRAEADADSPFPGY